MFTTFRLSLSIRMLFFPLRKYVACHRLMSFEKKLFATILETGVSLSWFIQEFELNIKLRNSLVQHFLFHPMEDKHNHDLVRIFHSIHRLEMVLDQRIKDFDDFHQLVKLLLEDCFHWLEPILILVDWNK